MTACESAADVVFVHPVMATSGIDIISANTNGDFIASNMLWPFVIPGHEQITDSGILKKLGANQRTSLTPLVTLSLFSPHNGDTTFLV